MQSSKYNFSLLTTASADHSFHLSGFFKNLSDTSETKQLNFNQILFFPPNRSDYKIFKFFFLKK